ncbi:MAG TPA: DUF2726 domain-containing protein [Phycisphaerae bacterium]|nr:DUF2726 domain-containing protein [Phycisphaerae bacterium]
MGKLVSLLALVAIALTVFILVWHKPKSLREFLAILYPDESKKLDYGFPYHARTHLLSAGEMAFYRVLLEAVGDRYKIAMKVRLADVITCPADSWHAGYGPRISQKHVDFVLTEPSDFRIVAVIELNDRTHRQTRRRKRDEFLREALRVADVPFVTFVAAPSYNEHSVKAALADALGMTQPASRELSH